MSATLTVDTTRFNAMCRDLLALSNQPGKTMGGILRAEAGKLLETAIKYTPMAKQGKVKKQVTGRIERRYNTYSNGFAGREANDRAPYISVSAKKGTVWWVTKKNGKRVFHDMNGFLRWPDEMWTEFMTQENKRVSDRKSALKEALLKALGAIGLARQSWLQIADVLGIPVTVTNKGRIVIARPGNGMVYVNGTGGERSSGNKFFIELINKYPPLVNSLNGSGILQRALNARASAFATEVEKGVFDDLATAAKRHPGVFIT